MTATAHETPLVLVAVALANLPEAIGGSAHISMVQGFAGGATIAVLAGSLIPEAYKEGGWWIGMATAAGFLVAFVVRG